MSDASTTTPPDSGGSPTPGTTACPARGPIKAAPADVDEPIAASGPYLWRNVQIVAGGFVSGIVFSPAQADVVYARTDIGGAYRWNGASRRWMPLLDWVGRPQSNWAGVESIAADPLDANIVYVAAGTYVASGPGVILRSDDQGRTFRQVTMTSIPMGGNNDGRSVGERLAVDPNDTNTVYFGSRNAGLWKSSDHAVSFTHLEMPGLSAPDGGPGMTTPNGVGVSFVQFDPYHCGESGPTVVYAGVATLGPSLFRSIDGGVTWSAVPGEPMGMLPSHAAISSSGMLFVTYGGGAVVNGVQSGSGPNNVTTGAVFRLDTNANTWTDVTPMLPTAQVGFGYAGVSVDAQNPNTVVVSTLDRWSIGDDIFRSTDSGAHWTPVNVPRAAHDSSAGPWVTFHQAAPNFTGWMADVEIDPFNSGRVMHVTGQGIWATDNMTSLDSSQPTSWDFRSTGIEETAVLDLVSPTAGPPLFSAVGDIGGFTHADLDVPPPGGIQQNPQFSATDSIDYAGAAPAIVARIGRGGAATSPHGAYSTDSGTTWTPFPTSLPIGNSAGSIAVSADGATFVWSPQAARGATGAVQYSRDRGMTWAPSGGGIGAIRPVVSDRVNPNKFYAFDGTGRLWVSTDGAATFAVAASGLPTGNGGRARATLGIEGDLWVVAGGNLFHSTDSGATFAPVATASAVFAMGFGMAAPGQSYPAIYLGGTVNNFAGIYRSDDVGATWTRIDDNNHRFATATVITGDPRIYGRVYVGNNGRGVFYGDPAN